MRKRVHTAWHAPAPVGPGNRTMTPAKLNAFAHLCVAVGWSILCAYLAYDLSDKYMHREALTILHALAPVLVLLIAIRAWRRYVGVRSALQ